MTAQEFMGGKIFSYTGPYHGKRVYTISEDLWDIPVEP